MTLKKISSLELNSQFWSSVETGSTGNSVLPSTKTIAGSEVTSSETANTAKKVETTPTTETETQKRRANRYTFEQKLQLIRASITNSLSDPVIQQAVVRYNYDQAKLQEGATLLADVEALHYRQQTMLAGSLEQTRTVMSAQDAAEKTLKRFIGIARIAFEGQEQILDLLQANTDRKKSFAEWLETGRLFYTSALSLPSVLTEFARYSVTQQDLEAGRNQLLEADSAKNRQFSASGDSQDLTEQKMIAFGKLWDWWMDYRRIVRMALRQQPQLMEKMGITVPIRSIPRFTN